MATASNPPPVFLPSEGGTYERQKDGSLKRVPEGGAEPKPANPPKEQ